MEKVYLGDAIYAEFDGYQVWLTIEYGLAPTNRIALKPSVIANFEEYLAKLKEFKEAIRPS